MAGEQGGEERLPELVRSRVAFARHGLAYVHGLQSSCCGVAVAALALAAGIYSGAEIYDSGLIIVALCNGTLAGLSCATAFRRSPQEVARNIDRSLGLRGALFTAWEVEDRDHPTELARRLGHQVAERVPARTMLGAVMSNVTLFLALPFAAAALLLAVLGEARHGADAQDLATLTYQVEQGLASISQQGAQGSDEGSALLGPEEQKQLRELMGKAADLAERVREGQALPEELEALGQELAEFEADVRDSERVARELDLTMNSVDAARMALQGREGSGDEVGPGEDSQEAGKSGSGGRTLAPGGEDGRMSGQEISPSGRDRQAEAGVLGIPSWPRAHETIVRRWVETARKSRSPR